jgi:hypothetical protein
MEYIRGKKEMAENNWEGVVEWMVAHTREPDGQVDVYRDLPEWMEQQVAAVAAELIVGNCLVPGSRSRWWSRR